MDYLEFWGSQEAEADTIAEAKFKAEAEPSQEAEQVSTAEGDLKGDLFTRAVHISIVDSTSHDLQESRNPSRFKAIGYLSPQEAKTIKAIRHNFFRGV